MTGSVPPEPIAELKRELTAIDGRARRLLQDSRSPGPVVRRAEAMDRAIRALCLPFGTEAVAVLAVGGYGARDLVPGSDVDLLFVHPPGGDEAAHRVAEAVLYPLWDAGFKASHAVRTPEECASEAARHLESLTSMLGARVVAGPDEAAARVRVAVAQVVLSDRTAFVERLRAAREERRGRFGSAGESLEPELKEGLGGTRDTQLFRWVAFGLFGDRVATSPDPYGGELATLGGLLLRSADAWRPASRGLGSERYALHLVNGGSSNVLGAHVQGAVAALLGRTSPVGWEPADGLLREVALRARGVEFVVDSVLDRLSSLLVASRGLRRSAPDRGASWAEQTMDLLAAVAEHAVAFGWQELSPDAVVGDEGQGGPGEHRRFEWSPRALESFCRILSAGSGTRRALGLLDVADLWRHVLPEWEEVRGRPQRDPYHRFPVDVHLAETVVEVAAMLERPGDPFVAEAAASVDDPRPLLLGALLHDIGKIGKGSHVAEGARVAAGILDRLGVEGGRREDVLFLVGEHLLLSDTATRRNIDDEDLVVQVAARIREQRRLAMLYLLTVADARATGPAASTPWRMALVRDLVARVSRTFDRGLMNVGRADRLAQAAAAVRAALLAGAEKGGDPAAVDEFLGEVPAAYLLWVRPEETPAHAALILPPPRPDEVRTTVRPGEASGTYRVGAGAVDRLGLLSSIAGAMTLSGLSILSAQAFTTGHGVALDLFDVRGAFEPEVGAERWQRFDDTLLAVVAGDAEVTGRVRELRAHYERPRAGIIPVHVRVERDASDFYTVIEVEAADRLGLLFDLTRTLAALSVDVHLAKVATYGPRVVDVFYVTDQTGEKLDDARAARLSEALTDAVSG